MQSEHVLRARYQSLIHAETRNWRVSTCRDQLRLSALKVYGERCPLNRYGVSVNPEICHAVISKLYVYLMSMDHGVLDTYELETEGERSNGQFSILLRLEPDNVFHQEIDNPGMLVVIDSTIRRRFAIERVVMLECAGQSRIASHEQHVDDPL